jgi:hypothetical protein
MVHQLEMLNQDDEGHDSREMTVDTNQMLQRRDSRRT